MSRQGNFDAFLSQNASTLEEGEEPEHGDMGVVGNDGDRAKVVDGSPNNRLHKASIGELVEDGCDVKAQNPNLTAQVVNHSRGGRAFEPLSDAVEPAAPITDLQDVRTEQKGFSGLFEIS